ncbi:MAG TPA: DNA polymerase I [Firmicutes bacterium]|jgi:DNA polymerase-1|nr:DNA polymerase I [Bacillota bacterium]
MAGRRLLLVDANSLANRAFYALPPLSTSKGVPTNAVYGFLTMLFRLIDERQPEYIICAFDHPSPTFRHVEFEDYKATRAPSPDEFKVQIPMLKDALSALDMAFVELPGFEADDIIGTLACKYSAEGFDVLILSGDKDCLQLVGEGREAILFVRGISQHRQYDREAVKQDMGVWPEQIPDFKGLAGDQSDNIPGVKGVGVKTATKLLNQYRDIEQIYANIDQVSPSRVQKLLKDQQQIAFLSKRLATIACGAPCHVDVEDARWDGPDVEKARDYFNNMEFQSLLRRLDRFGEGSAQIPAEVSRPDAYEVIDSEDKLKALAGRIAESEYMSVYAGMSDIDSQVSRDFLWPQVFGVSSGGQAYLIDFRRGELADPDSYQDIMWKYLGPVLQDSQIKKSGFDVKWLYTLGFHKGIALKGFGFDVMVAAYLLDPTRTTYKLEGLANNYLGEDMPQSIESLPRDQRTGADAQKSHMAHLALGSFFAFKLADKMKSDLETNGLWTLASDVEFPMIEVLAAMEALGIGIDLSKGQELREEFARKLAALEREIYETAGQEFNLSSPKQLSYILFDKLNLLPVKKTKTGYSTDAEVLMTLSAIHPLPEKILDHRHYAKLKSTYLDILESVVNPITGRIHSTFHQTVTATGRLSSSEPNLQNIPVRTESGKAIREIFVPAPGKLFLASDYSQIELRVMAHMSGDDSMIEAFRRDHDIHKATASEMFGVPMDKVTPDLREKAKAVNFGVIYGISDFGLARNTGVSREEARQFIEAYFRRYPLVKQYMDDMVVQARRTGYVTTILGRRRPIPEINSRNRVRRGFAERTAINTPIQGSAADLIKLAMVRLYRRIVKEGLRSRIILQVHDELIFETVPEEQDYMMQMVKEEMEGVMELKVPLKVDIDVGASWADV